MDSSALIIARIMCRRSLHAHNNGRVCICTSLKIVESACGIDCNVFIEDDRPECVE